MYNLKVSKNQAKVISEAVELYTRLHIGQIDQLDSFFLDRTHTLVDPAALDILRKAYQTIKTRLFPELVKNSYHSIRSYVVPEKAKIAYDIVQVINHKLSLDSYPNGNYSVYSQDPIQCSKEELSKIEGGK